LIKLKKGCWISTFQKRKLNRKRILIWFWILAPQTDNDKSDNDGNEPLTALLSAANSPNFEIGGSESGYYENISAENNLYPEIAKDIYDPGNWEHVTCAIRNLLVEKGPIRLPDDHKYPINVEKRHFSRKFYIREMPNKDCIDRQWLIYLQLKDATFCFCCKLYGKSSAGQLANEGCNDWKHLGGKLKKHELTPEHTKHGLKLYGGCPGTMG
jgi:hypothetical protein